MLTGGAYGVLFLLGLAEGVVGSFQYTWLGLGPVPLGALLFCVLILVTCAFGFRNRDPLAPLGALEPGDTLADAAPSGGEID